MYSCVTWRYNKRNIDEFDTFKEAKKFGDFGSDDCLLFFDCITNEDNVIVYDNKKIMSFLVDHHNREGEVLK